MILAFTALLVGVNAFFVLMEFALMRVRPARVEVLARKGSARAAAVQDVLSRLDEYIAAMQVCLASIAIALGAVAEPDVMAAVSGALTRWVGVLPPASIRAISFATAVAALAIVQLLFAEMVPRAVAANYAEPIALVGARPLKVLAWLLRVPIRLTTSVSRGLLALFGLKRPSEVDQTVGVDEMRVLLGEAQEKGRLPLERLLLLENLFDFGAAKAAEAMRPRERIAFLSLAKPWAENLAVIRDKRFTRYPLCELGLDTVVGYVHLKDLILSDAGAEPDLRRLRRDLFETTEAEPLERLVKTMPDKGAHMALVRDAGGRVAGLLTLEDVFEEIVGEIKDEFSRPRDWADGLLFTRAAVDANLPPGERDAAIARLLERLKTARPELDAKAAFDAVWGRELKFASAVGRGVLVPHARLPGLPEPMIAVGRYAKPPAVPTPDGVPIRLVFLILTPAETPVAQLKILQRIASLVTNETLRRRLWRVRTDESLLELLRTADTLLAA
jgi:CBS domain containing-hemolysin-like protein/mannitol/fructose-specific phosphotransferase system IIA component (Ntr-type)